MHEPIRAKSRVEQEEMVKETSECLPSEPLSIPRSRPARVDADFYQVDREIILDETGRPTRCQLRSPLWVKLKPKSITYRPYCLTGLPDTMYPPSSKGWVTRVSYHGEDKAFMVQEVKDSPRLWLTISDPDSGNVYEEHLIQPYEAEFLQIVDDYIQPSNGDQSDAEAFLEEILGQPSPDWTDLAKIAGNVYIPNFRLGETVFDTLDQLIPEEYPQYIRRQMALFLYWRLRDEPPREDPIQFITRFRDHDFASGLLSGYFYCILSDAPVPDYLRLFHQAARKELSWPERAMYGDDPPPHRMAIYRLSEMTPNLSDVALKVADQLNTSSKLSLSLPYSKKDALRSREAWATRFICMGEGLHLRGIPRPETMGLKRFVYIGSAHQWPHRHMAWAASMNGCDNGNRQLQVMLFPPSAVDRVLRARPKLIEIGWQYSNFNTLLYNKKGKGWTTSVKRILNALNSQTTLRKLQNEFGGPYSRKPVMPTKQEVMILDLVRSPLYLSELEMSFFLEKHDTSAEDIKSTLNSLLKRRGVDLCFRTNLVLQSCLTIAQGRPEKLYYLSRAFLRHTPASLVMLSADGGTALVLSRTPPKETSRLMQVLPKAAKLAGIDLRMSKILSYRSYVKNLLQRLHLNEREWDDDVSAMLSQVRLRSSREPEDCVNIS